MLPKMLESHKKVAILGVGSELNGDDCAGILAAKKLKGLKNADVFIAAQSPENYTHLSRGGYSHIIIIDALHFGGAPGEIRYFEGGKLAGNEASTHKLPIRLFIGYVQKNCDAKIIIGGIEPKSTGFGEKPGPEVKEAVKKLVEEIKSALK